MGHHHLRRDERVILAALLRAGHTQAECARELGVNRSTISREIKRSPKEYRAVVADKQASTLRRQSKYAKRKIENNKKLGSRIIELLKKGRSPEQAAYEIGSISDDAIYAWIERSEQTLASLLPQRGRVRRRYGKNTGEKQGWTKLVRSIALRPAAANNRSRVGHWEGDTIVGRDRARLLVHVDRKSRFIVTNLMPEGTADTTHATSIKAFAGLPCRTITYDRGSEFALWKLTEEKLETKIYFAGAHHPWERGTSENSNGLLRRYFPKGTPFGEKLQKDIAKAVWLINHRPRKCLNWKTPCRVFKHCCNSG